VLFDRFSAGLEGSDGFFRACDRITESELALTDRLDDHAAVYRRAVVLANVLELMQKQKLGSGARGVTLAEYQHARYHHLSQRIKLLETMDRLKKRDGR
jgi:hypothetical protein